MLLALVAGLGTAAAGCADENEPSTDDADVRTGTIVIGNTRLTIDDQTPDHAGARIRPIVAEAVRRITETEPGAWLASRLGNAGITLILVDAHSVSIHVVTERRAIEANPGIFDRLPVETMSAVLAHELEHIAQDGIALEGGLNEFAALSLEYQVWASAGSAASDTSPEANRLVAYAHYPSAVLQLWRGSKYSWAQEPFAPLETRSSEVNAYWRTMLEREGALRAAGGRAVAVGAVPSEGAWVSIDAYVEGLTKGDNWQESGVAERKLARPFVVTMNRLAEDAVDTVVAFPEPTEAETFALDASFAGTFDADTHAFRVTLPVRRLGR